MQFVLVLAILAALVLAESSPSGPVAGGGVRLGIAVLGVILVAIFPMVFSGWIARRLRWDFERRSGWLALFRHLRHLHVVLSLAVAGGIYYWLDWARLVRFNWHLEHVILLDEVLILLPILLPIVISWAAFYEVDHAMRLGLADDPSLAEESGRWRYLALHVRHYLGVLLLPVFGLLAVQDMAELLAPGVLQSAYAPAVYAPPILILFVGFPWLLRHVWRTSPLERGSLRERLESAAARAGFAVREILVWHTDERLVNAAVAGFVPRLRYVFLSDALLSHLDDEEVEAVFGHEMGHVRHHHLALRVLAMVAPLSLWLLAERALPGATGRLEDWLAGAGLGLQLPAGLAMLAGMALYAFFVFGAYSRMLEAQADLFGCRTLGCGGGPQAAEAFASALEKLAAASGVDRRARTWQHGSVARRVEMLRRVAEDPSERSRLERRMGMLAGLVLAVVFSPVVFYLIAG